MIQKPVTKHGARRFQLMTALAVVSSCSFASSFVTRRETSSLGRLETIHPPPPLPGKLSPIAVRSSSLENPKAKQERIVEKADDKNRVGQNEEYVVEKAEECGGIDKKRQRYVSVGVLLATMTALIVAAKTGILSGPLDGLTGEFGVYTDAMIVRDVGSTALTAALGYAFVKTIIWGYEKGWYSSKVSRKLSHTLSAPLFMLFFPIFSEADGARYFAALVTFVNVVRLYLSATSDLGDSSLALSVSRSGDTKEALGGPFIYVCLFQLSILLFWRTSMTGIVAISTMAAGDGMADLVGRRWGKENKWWFSESKSIAGSTAFAVSSSLTSFGLVKWLISTGCLESSLSAEDLALRIVGISVACAVVELLPFGDDNYTVPLSAAALAALFLH